MFHITVLMIGYYDQKFDENRVIVLKRVKVGDDGVKVAPGRNGWRRVARQFT